MRQTLKKSFISSSTSALALVVAAGLSVVPSSAHAATAQNLTVTSFQDVNGFCFANFTVDVTGTRDDSTNGAREDQVEIFMEETDTFNASRNNRQQVTVGQTRTINARVDLDPFPRGTNLTALNLVVRDGRSIIARTPLNLSALNAAGSNCARVARAAGFGNQAPTLDFGGSFPTDNGALTFGGSTARLSLRANGRDPENDPLSYTWTQVSGRDITGRPITNQTFNPVLLPPRIAQPER